MPKGRIVEADGAEPTFRIDWIESYGPTVTKPEHCGFGQIVIVTMAGATVQGKAEVDYLASGICWELEAPLRGVAAA